MTILTDTGLAVDTDVRQLITDHMGVDPIGLPMLTETFPSWMERIGGVKVLADELRDLDYFPKPDEGPEFYVDYDETGPYVAEVGESECAT